MTHARQDVFFSLAYLQDGAVHQLSLFEGIAPAPEPAPPPAAPELPAWPEPSSVLPGQLHLFSDRTVRLAEARAAIAEARLDDARRVLAALKKRFPEDPFIAREAARAATLQKRYAAALDAPAEGRPEALLTFARSLGATEEPWASLRRAVLCRVAAELDRGPVEAPLVLEGQPPGFYWLEAGAFEEARASLTRSLARGPSVRGLFLLGDASLLLGAGGPARRHYLEALLLDPFDAALAAVRLEEVRALPATARDELEIEEEPAAWSAPVGMVTGVFPLGVGLSLEGLALLEVEQPAGRAVGAREALGRARAFARALVEMGTPEGRGRVVELRRQMKQISPRLFAAYMDRVVRAQG
uniref:Uncharacterized protein n=1 Tax=Byssovorax cruenta TaxID=293647 RepID=A0A3S5GXX5_9BACT|nr:hypothetical protein [Byssovorax cruenta]